MRVLKYGLFLVIGIAAQACGGGSDGDGGDGGDDDTGGSTGKGGSANGGSSNGGSSSGSSGASNGGSANGGSANGGSANGGSATGGSATGGSATGGSSNGGSSSGTAGTGGIDTTCTMAGYVSIMSIPSCADFYTCYVEAVCSQTGQGQACVDATLTALKDSVCYPAGTDLATACEQAKAVYAAQPMFAECAD